MLSITNDDFILFIVTLIFVGIGVFGKDYSNTLSGKDKGIKFFRMIFVMVTIATLMVAAIDIFSKFNDFFYLFLCIVAGWMNYSLPVFLDNIGSALVKKLERWARIAFGSDNPDMDKLIDEMEKMREMNEKIIKNQEDIKAELDENDEDSGDEEDKNP